MDRPSFRERYTGSFDKYEVENYCQYRSVRAPKRASNSAIRQPYCESLNFGENHPSPIQMMYKKRLFYPTNHVRPIHPEGNSYLRYRRSTSRGRDELSRERYSSRETLSPEEPLRHYENPKIACPPRELVPNFRASDAFREDVLRVVSPLLKQIKESFGQLPTEESKASPRHIYSDNQVPKQDERTKSDIKKIENRIAGFERELKVIHSDISNIQPEAILQKFNKSQNKTEDVKKIVRESIEKYHRDNPSPWVQLDVEGKLRKMNNQIDDMDLKISSVQNNQGNDGNSEEIEEVYTMMDDYKAQIRQLQQENNEFQSKFKSLSSSFENLKVEFTENQQLTENDISIAQSLESSQGQVTLSQVNSMLEDLEKKISKALTTSLNEVQDQMKHINKEELEKLFTEVNNLSEFADGLHKEQSKISNEKIKEMIKKEISSIPAVPQEVQDEIYALQQDIEQIQSNMEGYSETLRNLPTKEGILSKVDEKIVKAKQEQSMIDAAQDMNFDNSVLDVISQKCTKLQEQVDDQEKELHSELQNLGEDFQAFKDTTNKNQESIAESIHTVDEKVTQVSTNLSSQLQSFEEAFNDIETQVGDLVEFKTQQLKLNKEDKVAPVQQKISTIEEMLKKDSESQKLQSLEKRFDEIETQIQQDKEQNSEEITVFKNKIDEIQVSASAPQAASIDEDAMQAIQQDFDERFNELSATIKKDYDKLSSKINGLNEDVERADEVIKTSIQSLKDQSGEEISSLFEKILQIKNELIEDSRKLKERFERIDKEETDKQEFVLKELKRLDAKIEEQAEEFDKDLHNVSKGESTSVASTVNNSEVNSKISELKAEMLQEISNFKEEATKDRDFERDRILNCVQDINDSKKLMDTKIDEYDKKIVAKFAEVIDSNNEVREFAIETENSVKEAENLIKTSTSKIKEIEDKVFETMQKYGRVAKQANDIEVRIETLEEKVSKGGVMSPSDFEEKPLQIEESKGEKDKFEMTDLFKNFNEEKDAKTSKPEDKAQKDRYGADADEQFELESLDDEDDDDDPDLQKAKETAIKGIKDLEQYQKSHPAIEQRTSSELVKKWIGIAENANDEKTLHELKDEIFDEAGYDIMEEEIDESYEDPFEGIAGGDEPKESSQLDDFSGIELAGTEEKDKKPKNEGSDEYSEEFGDDYEDDFDF
ncbi:unnamed protein product [Moneuplotes crassus]|uniref:Uncharacterized protein n=1 Tax=Euplotes crassus TaxID=5936 RepID=A0AAD1XI85_EUPCR|nr:unnamed protein product [Moneuplotes crassus]